MPFIEFGQKSSTEEWKGRTADRRERDGREYDRARPPANPLQQRCVASLRPSHQRWLDGLQPPARKQQRRKSRSHRECYGERSHDREDVGDPKRSEEPASYPGKAKHRQHHQDHGKGRIDDRTPDFQTCIQNDRRSRARLRQRRVFPQPACNVFDIDDRIVHNHADRYGEPAQSHGVQRGAEALQHDGRCEQRERNGDGGDGCRSQVEKKKEENDDDEDTAEDQRTLYICRRCFDEVGRAKEIGMNVNSIRRSVR